MSQTSKIMTIIDSFANRMVRDGHGLIIDGVKVFEVNDPFLSGKIALGLSYWVTADLFNPIETKKRCQHFNTIMQGLKDHEVDSWGIHFYLKALKVLDDAGVIGDCFESKEFVHLKRKLDWRKFVDETSYELQGKANNFYGIAYSIAYTRYQLGWDSQRHSRRILARELEHYEVSSGGLGFADDTNGRGKYDRYSFLLIAEIANRFHEAGRPIKTKMKKWLKLSVDYVLYNVNESGDGFQWGRSIGAYGDSAFMEILTAAYNHNVLTSHETEVACYFVKKVTDKFLQFWYQEDRGSVNLWSDGRATDGYRGKNRILGENLSLLHQHLYCQRVWEKHERYNQDVELDKSYKKWVSDLNRISLTNFSKGICNYAVINYRSLEKRYSIPLVNGDRYYNQMVYQPVPFSKEWIRPIPEFRTPLCRPIAQNNEGTRYIPYPCFSNVRIQERKSYSEIGFKAAGFTELRSTLPYKSLGGYCKTTHRFSNDSYSVVERVKFGKHSRIEKIDYLFPVGVEVTCLDCDRVRFLTFEGSVKELEFSVDDNVEVILGDIEQAKSTVENGTPLYRKYTVILNSLSVINARWNIRDVDN